MKSDEVNLTRIEWTTELPTVNGEKTEKFRIQLFHTTPFIGEASCLHNSFESGFAFDLHQPKPEIELRLTLAQAQLPSISGSEDEDDEIFGSKTLPDNVQEPIDVWAEVNEVEKIPLAKSSQPNEWKTKKFRVKIPASGTSPPLKFVFWIKFENNYFGERILLTCLKKLFVNQTQCDVQFYFDDNSSVGGHVNLLSARSPVFAAMFQNGMKESITGRVNVKDIQSDIFKELLHYIYTGRTETPLSQEIAQLLFVAAEIYYIQDLKEKCSQFITQCIRTENAISLLTWANRYMDEELEEKVLGFMAEHGKEICQLDDWEKLTVKNPYLCLLATRRMIK